MDIKLEKTYTLELSWTELRDLSNALYTTLQVQNPHLKVGEKFPESSFKELFMTINKEL